ncbi:phosphoglucosamine mutase [Gottschalkiaceae bacterium SANA]|nr:phosphoglucosamine mutase [Gottschalkiaceae bacterium SANA]
MARLFGTDGVRGVANSELTPELAFQLGRVATYVITKGVKQGKVIVGMDTRRSCDLLEAALVAGICSVGSDALCVGVVPTPAVAFLTREYEADAGVVISASHNPVEFNGIKFFNRNGFKLTDEMEDEIEAIIASEEGISYRPIGRDVGQRIAVRNGVGEYLDFLENASDISLKGVKVVLDCGNGASYQAAPAIFERLGAEAIVINHSPNGLNINVECGSTHPDGLQELVLESGADFGLAFDGDADRLMGVDEHGNLIDGDHVLAICARSLKEQGKLKNNMVVGTIMANLGLNHFLDAEGIDFVQTKVGDRYVLEAMRAGDYALGGEQSGHIIFLEHNTTGDGLLSAIKLSEAIVKSGLTASELANSLTKYPQVLLNAIVSNQNKHAYMEDEEVAKRIAEIEAHFHGEGRVVIRPSGTEPLVRVMLEGKDEIEMRKMAADLVKLIETRLGK